MDFLAQPFVWLLKFLCELCNSYAIAIVVFTVVVNLAMLPFNIKQQKNMAKQARLRPKLDLIKEKCGGDKMKYQSAMTELYQKEKVSPTGGCLPMVIRMVVLIAVYSSVQIILGKNSVNSTPMLGESYFYLFGLNLGETPKFTTDIVKMVTANFNWVIPILCFVSQMGSMVISNTQQKRLNPQMASQGNSMFIMMLIMPVFSLVITFRVSLAVGLYWTLSSLVNTAIQLLVNHFYSADKLLAKQAATDGCARRLKEKSVIEKTEN